MGSVGFELYSLYIKEVLSKLKNAKAADILPQDVIVNLYKNAIIPEEYISSPSIRISFYRKLSSVNSMIDVDNIEYELIDRFGPFPRPIQRLINNWKMKISAASCGVLSIEKKGSLLSVILCQSTLEHSVDLVFKSLPEISTAMGWEYHFKSQKNDNLCILFNIVKDGDISSKVLMFMDKLQAIIKL